MPEPEGSKYSRGQALVVGGARATPGGVLLAGRAALRTGAGRLSVAVAASVAHHVAVALPGGELQIRWPANDAPLAMAGPTAFVYEGQLTENATP